MASLTLTERFEHDIRIIFEARSKEILEEVIEKAKGELVQKLRREAATMALTVASYADIKHYQDRIIITLRQET